MQKMSKMLKNNDIKIFFNLNVTNCKDEFFDIAMWFKPSLNKDKTGEKVLL